MSTFSKLRVGKKRYFAGVPVLVAKVDGSVATTVGTLPAGAVVLSGVATAANIDATISDGITTATINTLAAAHVPANSDTVATIAGAGVITITAAAAGDLLISYILTDVTDGANA